MDVRKLHVPLALDPTVVSDRPRTLVTAAPLGNTPALAPAAAAPPGKRGVYSEYLLRPLDYQEPVAPAGPKTPLPPIRKSQAQREPMHGYQQQQPPQQQWRQQDTSPLQPHPPMYAAATGLPSTRSFQRPASKRDSLTADLPENRAAEGGKKQRDHTQRVQVNYRKALEPKVMLPFLSRPGQTPRKIEIERRKRVYSSKQIETLVIAELDALKAAGVLGYNPMTEFNGEPIQSSKDAAVPSGAGMAVDAPGGLSASMGPHAALSASKAVGTVQPVIQSANFSAGFVSTSASASRNSSKPTTDYSHLLPLAIFDDAQFDPRTPDDWLDMSTIPDELDVQLFERISQLPRRRGLVRRDAPDIRHAVVPLPAKAFNGFEWRDCVVVAYDDKFGKWKVKWRSFDGWLLDRKSEDDAIDGLDAEDEALRDDYDREMDDPRSVTDKEAWLDR
ncbi:hypothetical protein BC831DRAFT_212635 [Entophlyctis helioformis]|nr:hypothetical protein BC831DRAFT_212635 [Entophlyctis helioformis]